MSERRRMKKTKMAAPAVEPKRCNLKINRETLDRWNTMKLESNTKTHDQFVTAVLDAWSKKQPGNHLFANKKMELTPGGGKTTWQKSKMYRDIKSKAVLPSVNQYPGCFIKGLPILKPFTSVIDAPEEDEGDEEPEVGSFVIIPYESETGPTEVLDLCDKDNGLDGVTVVETPDGVVVKAEVVSSNREGMSASDVENSLNVPFGDRANDSDNDDANTEPLTQNDMLEADVKLEDEAEDRPYTEMQDSDKETKKVTKETKPVTRTRAAAKPAAARKRKRPTSVPGERKAPKRITPAIKRVRKPPAEKKEKSEKKPKAKPGPKPKKNKPAKKPWTTIKLEEHMDKYTMETFSSIEQRYRKKKSEKVETLFNCIVCNAFKAGSREVFERHIEEHVNEFLLCKQCGYEASTRRILRTQHILECSGTDLTTRQNVCDICGNVTLSKETHLHHMGLMHNQLHFKCKFCDEMFPTKMSKKRHHIEKHCEEIKYCKVCCKFRTSLTVEQFQEHKASCSDSIPCHLCGKLFSNRSSSLQMHLARSHGNIRAYQCHLCAYSAKNKKSLDRHLLVHKGIHPYKCDQCSFTCVQKSNLKSHMRRHTGEKPFKCDQCTFAAAYKVQLKDHMKVHGLHTALPCPQCGIVFKNCNCFNTHTKKDHADTIPNDNRNAVQPVISRDMVAVHPPPPVMAQIPHVPHVNNEMHVAHREHHNDGSRADMHIDTRTDMRDMHGVPLPQGPPPIPQARDLNQQLTPDRNDYRDVLGNPNALSNPNEFRDVRGSFIYASYRAAMF